MEKRISLKETKFLKFFFLANTFISGIFIFFSLLSFFVSRGSEPASFLRLIVWLLMGIPFYFSLIPFFTFILRNRLNSIFVGIISVLWSIFLFFILLLIIGVFAQTSFNVDMIPFLKKSPIYYKPMIKILSTAAFLFMLWFLFSKTTGKKVSGGSKQIAWFLGLLGVFCGLFMIFLGFLILFVSLKSLGIRILGASLLFIIGLGIWFVGYSMIRAARGQVPKFNGKYKEIK